MEIFTGGRVKAGYHEVAVVDSTIAAMEKQKAAGRPLWRISSTLFYHTASDNILEPLGHFKTEESLNLYHSEPAGDQVRKELGFLSLANDA